MPTIAANTYRLPVVEKLVKGDLIVSLSTDNPDVPGNEAAVARLAAAQEVLRAANAAYESLRLLEKQLLTERDNAVAEWNAAVNGLATLTEFITGGDPTKILTTGFEVRTPKTPPQPVGTVDPVIVRLDPRPGYSLLQWPHDPQAYAYRVQCCPDETITDENWREAGITTEARFRGNGATPGRRCWYRVAAVNSLGQGPWSMPASRPVL